MLEFVTKYGMLGPPLTRSLDDLRQIPEPEVLGSVPEMGKYVEYLTSDGFPKDSPSWSWREHVHSMNAAREYWYRLQRGIRDGWDKWDEELEANTQIPHIAKGFKNEVEYWLSLTMSPRLVWSPSGKGFEFRYAPRSLISAIWMQLALSLSDAKTFRQCPICDRIIEVSKESTGARTDATFCSDKCRSQDYRDRKKLAGQLKKKGWKIPRIAKEVGSKQETVRGWLKAKK